MCAPALTTPRDDARVAAPLDRALRRAGEAKKVAKNEAERPYRSPLRETRKALLPGPFIEADDRARTDDLLHGKDV